MSNMVYLHKKKYKFDYVLVKPKITKKMELKTTPDGKKFYRLPIIDKKSDKNTDVKNIKYDNQEIHKINATKNSFNLFLVFLESKITEPFKINDEKMLTVDERKLLFDNLSMKSLGDKGDITPYAIYDKDELYKIIGKIFAKKEIIKLAIKNDLTPLEAIALFLHANTPLSLVDAHWAGYNMSALKKIHEKSPEDLPKYTSIPKEFAKKYGLTPEEGHALYWGILPSDTDLGYADGSKFREALSKIRATNPDALQDFLPSGATDGEKYALLLGLPNPVDLTEEGFEALTNFLPPDITFFLSPDITFANIDNKDRHTLAKTLLKIRATNSDALQGFLPSGATDGEKYALLLGLPNPVDLKEEEFDAFVKNILQNVPFGNIPDGKRPALSKALLKISSTNGEMFDIFFNEKVKEGIYTHTKVLALMWGFKQSEDEAYRGYDKNKPFNAIPKAEKKPLRSAFKKLRESDPAFFRTMLPEKVNAKWVPFFLGFTPDERRLLKNYALKEPSEIQEGERAQFNALLEEVKSFFPQKCKYFSPKKNKSKPPILTSPVPVPTGLPFSSISTYEDPLEFEGDETFIKNLLLKKPTENKKTKKH